MFITILAECLVTQNSQITLLCISRKLESVWCLCVSLSLNSALTRDSGCLSSFSPPGPDLNEAGLRTYQRKVRPVSFYINRNEVQYAVCIS